MAALAAARLRRAISVGVPPAAAAARSDMARSSDITSADAAVPQGRAHSRTCWLNLSIFKVIY